MTILDEILAHKRVEVDRANESRDAARLAEQARTGTRRPSGFNGALKSTPGIPVIRGGFQCRRVGSCRAARRGSPTIILWRRCGRPGR